MFIQFNAFQVFFSSYCDPLLVEILYKTNLLNLIGPVTQVVFFLKKKSACDTWTIVAFLLFFYYNFVFILIGILLTNIFFIYISINIPPLWFCYFSYLAFHELSSFFIVLCIFNFLRYYFNSFIKKTFMFYIDELYVFF